MVGRGVTALALVFATPAFAQDAAVAITPDEVRALRDEVAKLRAEVADLKAAQMAARPTPSAPIPSWKGGPQFSDTGGFSFKPKGTIQLDAGYSSMPGSTGGTVGPVSGTYGAAGVNTNNLGFNTRFRRAIVGAEGSIPGGFGYNVEVEFSQSSVSFEDVVLTWQGKGSPLSLRLGYQYSLQSLDQMTSGKFTSFTERAGGTDAYGNTRRIGLAGTWAKGDVALSAGIFGEDVANTSFARTGWQASARANYMPRIGDTQLHLGVNYQHRVAPRDAQNVRYRQRPYTQNTDQRFIDTGRIAADGDDVYGIELAALNGPLHMAAEAQWLKVRGFQDAAHAFGPNNGTGGTSAFLLDDPQFFSGYAELGWFVTGETRGYKGGRWDRTKVLKPLGKDGWGALQINARVDFTDLQDRVAAGAIAPGSLNFANGGKQAGYGVSAIWLPNDYVRFIAQYDHIVVTGGPAAVAAFTSPVPAFNDREYSVDMIAVRAQVDF